jgi:2'-5' RNA ligase
MKTLKEFMATRKYVAVQYDKESQDKLREWCLENGFDLSVKYGGEEQDPTEFDFHTTVFYSTNEVMLRNKISKLSPTEVTITKIKFLGENKDVPVFEIELTDGIKDLRGHFENLGLEDKWPSYEPHISLSYAKEQRDVSKIKLPDFKPKYDRLIIEDIKE